MLNRRYFTFERNHYFYGKLLTSRDFAGEQDYMNCKRRFINRTLHGSGIVCGMHVLLADDTSIVLQSGFALDASGREIVVPKTRVIKLAAIEGYQELTSEQVYLGIAYKEVPRDPVYSVLGDDASQDTKEQYNSIGEEYTLFLQDAADCAPIEKPEDTYLKHLVIYQDEKLKVTQTTPAYVTTGKQAILSVEIEKKDFVREPVSLQYQVKAEGCMENEFTVHMDHLILGSSETANVEYTISPMEYMYGTGELTIKSSEITVTYEDQTLHSKKEASAVILPVKENSLECVLEHSYKELMDAVLEDSYDQKLWIAGLTLLRSGSSVLVRQVAKPPFDQYVYNSRQLMQLHKLEACLRDAAVGTGTAVEQVAGSAPVIENKNGTQRINSSGVCDLSLGSGGGSGKVYFSEEIMHGLGNGPVYVEIGVEHLNEEAGEEREEIILGDHSIFAGEDGRQEEKPLLVDTAVKLLPDRGTFIIGVRPKTRTGRISIRLRWFAYRAENLAGRVEKKEQKGCIMIQPDTIVLAPKETVHINPVFVNMPQETVSYTLMDVEGGRIMNNGVYTAPAQEGVYEIRVASIRDPEIFSQAFAIVTQKKEEEPKG